MRPRPARPESRSSCGEWITTAWSTWPITTATAARAAAWTTTVAITAARSRSAITPLHYAWLYSVYYTNVNNNSFDMYGHSKGAAVTIRRHQTWSWVSSSYPGGVYYGVGVPKKYGSEDLSSYSLGYTKKYGPIVAMTFNDDPVKDIDECGDIGGAFGLVLSSANHDYNGFMVDHSGHSGSHRYDGDRFRAGTYDYVGGCYKSNDADC